MKRKGFDYAETKANARVREMLNELDLETLLATFRSMARTYTDGRYTIMAFTTGFKATFGTVDFGSGETRQDIFHILTRETLKDALVDALTERRGIVEKKIREAI